MTKPKTTTGRQAKTPAQRVTEQIGVEERRVAKLTDKAAFLTAQKAEVDHELLLAEQRLDWLRKHPDLKPDQGTNTTSTPQGDNAA